MRSNLVCGSLSTREFQEAPGRETHLSVVVMKFGGTSVANVDRIKNVARHVKREVDAGNKVAVVVSVGVWLGVPVGVSV